MDRYDEDSLFQQVLGPLAGKAGKKKRGQQALPPQQQQPQQQSARERLLGEENARLIHLLQQAKAEREQLLTDMAVVKKRALSAEIAVVEHETRRALEVSTFRAALQKERIRFDEKLVAAQRATLARDQLVVDLVEICTTYSIISPNAAAKAAIERASWQVPRAKAAAVATYRKYLSADAGAGDLGVVLGMLAGPGDGYGDGYGDG